jgi:Fur family transcriptional regulator, ferric uptake regulator
MATASLPEPWASVSGHLRQRGLRWTPQRRQVIEVLAESTGHVTGAEILERCRERVPDTVPSTVYRTLDVLEDLGLVRHGHGADGREEYHVSPADEHGHLYCEHCGGHWELSDAEVRAFVSRVEGEHRFRVDLSHLTLVGSCVDCASADGASGPTDA